MPTDPYARLAAGLFEELALLWPDGEKLKLAWNLARDVDTLEDLLAGRAVDAARLNRRALRRAKQATLVRLVSPLDLLEQDL